MCARLAPVLGFALVLTLWLALASHAASEAEPNDTPPTANPLSIGDMDGDISPVGDLDYFVVDGVNIYWGFIALLDTSGSTVSKNGTLTAYASDGTTVLQSDSGAWSQGSVIAWQHFVDGSASHYIRVSETGDDNTVTPYILHYYSIALGEQDEIEPNNSPATGTISAKTNIGLLSSASDVDCFSIYGRTGEDFLFALNADPESDGSNTDFALTVYAPDGSVLANADKGGVGGNEVIASIILSETGIYAYCINASSFTTSSNATYLAGPLRNGGNYLPFYTMNPKWLNPGPGNTAEPGDILSFQLDFTNSSPLAIPNDIIMYARFDENCLLLISAPGASYTTSNEAKWEMSDLGPGESFTATLETQAKAVCSDTVHQSVGMNYFQLGVGTDVSYSIVEPFPWIIFHPAFIQKDKQ